MANLKYFNSGTNQWEEIKVSTKFKELLNTETLLQAQNYVPINITNFNPIEDVMLVFLNSTWLQKDQDYVINDALLRIESKDGSNYDAGDVFNFVVLKNVDKDAIPTSDGSLLQDGSVALGKLASALQTQINKIGVTALTTSATTLSDAINELNSNVSKLSNPNLIINEDFQVWQRGTNFSITPSTSMYTADRWCAWILNGTGVTVNTNTNGGLKMQNTIAFTDNAGFNQIVEVPKSAREKTYTASINMNCTVSHDISLYVASYDGTTRTLITSKIITPNSTSSTYELSFTMPSTAYIIVGLALSTSTSNYYGLTSPTVFPVCTFNFNWAKLEQGSTATPFIPRLYAEELALCQRYFVALTTTHYYSGAMYNANWGIFNIPVGQLRPSTITVKVLTGTLRGMTGIETDMVTNSNCDSLGVDPAGVKFRINTPANIGIGPANLVDTTMTLDAEIY